MCHEWSEQQQTHGSKLAMHDQSRNFYGHKYSGFITQMVDCHNSHRCTVIFDKPNSSFLMLHIWGLLGSTQENIVRTFLLTSLTSLEFNVGFTKISIFTGPMWVKNHNFCNSYCGSLEFPGRGQIFLIFEDQVRWGKMVTYNPASFNAFN